MILATIENEHIEVKSTQMYSLGDWDVHMEGTVHNYNAFKMQSDITDSQGRPLPRDPESAVQVVADRLNHEWLHALARFDGNYALVCHNKVAQELHVITDAFCTRPLYFRMMPRVCIGTDLEAVHEDAPCTPNLTYVQLRDVLPFVPNDETLYTQVNRIRPYSYFVFNNQGALLHAGPYAGFSCIDKEGDPIKYLKDSIRRRVAKAPKVCVCTKNNDVGEILVAATKIVCHEAGGIPVEVRSSTGRDIEAVNLRCGVGNSFLSNRTELEALVKAPILVAEELDTYRESEYPYLYPPFVNALLSRDLKERNTVRKNLRKAFGLEA
jgi:hypothetical protein